MRLIATLFFLSLVHTQLIAQAPQRISYQAVVRNSSNGLVSSTQVGMRISILQGSSSGTAVYAERHTPTTNENGLLTIEIGGGTVESGTFSSIPWANGPFFIKSETDPAGGTSYSITGTTQLLSVPYALYANNAGNGMPPGTQAGQMLYWDGTKWTALPKGTNGQYLKWCNDTLTWGPCLPQVQVIELPLDKIGVNGAGLNFAIINDGGTYIMEAGICVSTNANPTFPNDVITYTDSHAGYYEINFGNLQPQTKYYVRPFARNSVGISYGNELSFTTKTLPSVPTVSIDSISSITQTSAKVWATIVRDSAYSLTQSGILIDTLSDPSVNRYMTIIYKGGNSDTISHLFQNLSPGKNYYAKAFAVNAGGYGYSNQIVFKTDTIPPPPPPPPAPTSLTDIDGNVYPVIKIANKHWISKNLDVTHYKNGDSIPHVQDAATWASLTTGAWCYYENQTANGTTYGKLYNWYAMNDSRGIAPEGWHVPNDEEWVAMIDSLGGAAIAGGKLKATSLWNSPNTGATNSSGFNGLPGGYRYYHGGFGYKGLFGNWWSSTPSQNSPYLGVFMVLANDSQQIPGPNSFEKEYGYSIRLIWNY